MAKQHILTLLAVIMCSIAQAQTFSIGGILRDAKSGDPIAFTNCVLLRGDSTFAYGTTTNDRGALRFESVDTGIYLLRISAIGYETYWRQIGVPQDTALGIIDLFQSSTTLQAVNITASSPLYSADGEKTFYHVEDDPSVQTGTMSDALQNAPGVEVDAEGNITLRGSSDVTIWINDKPSNLDGEALKQYIKALPASSVKRIEVINNPSARYGTTGAIINIITDKNVMLNHLVSVGFNAAISPYFQPWASYVWANEKVSVTAWLNGTFAVNKIKMTDEERLYESDGRLSTDLSFKLKEGHRISQGVAGVHLTWSIDSVTNLTVWGGGYSADNIITDEIDVSRWEYIYSAGDYSYHYNVNVENRLTGAFGGLWIQRQLDTLGQKISFSVNSNYNTQRQVQDRERIYTIQHWQDVHHFKDNNYLNWWTNFDLDYTKPYSSTGQIEAGMGAVLGRDPESTLWDTLNYATGLQMRDAMRTFSVRTIDNELNAYLTVQQKIQRLTLKGGARVYRKWKQTYYDDLPEETTQYDVDKSLWDVIPSFHASYSTEKGHNFTLSYTRRFSSPGAKLWSTYTMLQEEDFERGNPDLRSSHTHNLEGGWAMYKGWGSVGLTGYLRANTDELQQLSDVAYHPYYGRVVNFTQWANVGTSRTVGAETRLTWRPKPFMNVRLYANLYDYYYNAEFRPNQRDERHLLTFSGRCNVWAKLWDVLQVYANARYTTATLSLMSESKPSLDLDLGVSADLLKNRLSLFLNVNDVFGTVQFGKKSYNPYYQQNNRYTYNSRCAVLGLTWRIGKMELQSRAREGVSEPTM